MSLCKTCGAGLPPGKFFCVRCGEFTIHEVNAIGSVTKAKVTTLDLVEAVSIERHVTGGPWDGAWGGGIVPTSVTLLGGNPGCGKSTMLLQLASSIAALTGKKAYYLSAEQAPGEIRLSANRIGIPNIERFLVLSSMGGGVDIDDELLKEHPPALFIVDSISALCGKDTFAAWQIAKKYKLLSVRCAAPAFLVSHVNKTEGYAGLMALQHEVDTCIALTNPTEREATKLLKSGAVTTDEELLEIRVLAAIKNRYGSTAQDYFLKMTAHGLMALPPAPPKKPKKSRIALESLSQDQDLPPREKAKLKSAPETIVLKGQTLVRKPKKKVIELAPAKIEGEALKKRRSAMPKEVAAKLSKALGKKKVPA